MKCAENFDGNFFHFGTQALNLGINEEQSLMDETLTMLAGNNKCDNMLTSRSSGSRGSPHIR